MGDMETQKSDEVRMDEHSFACENVQEIDVNEEREFDLNIEKILDNWEIFHAIREIIANALDEQIITQTKEISIFKDQSGCWHIVDYGRGLNYHHLTQNENEEKLQNDKLIGKFGVGLKDALATLYRHNIEVRIKSKYGVITLKQASKAGFDDIITLHADIAKPEDENMTGTDFVLQGCSEEDIEKAKMLFLIFSQARIIEKTSYGDVIAKTGDIADIYINGVKVAEEPNFLFSYNITSLNAKLRKALNRERTNVGRTAYTDRIKAILLECNSEEVIRKLSDDLQAFGSGAKHDELGWQDVQLYASDQLRRLYSNTTFVTTEELQNNRALIDEMERGGYNPVVIPEALANKMEDYNQEAEEGEIFTTTQQFLENEAADFKPEIVDPESLSYDERSIFNQTEQILATIGGKPENVMSIEIAEKLFDMGYGIRGGTVGMWRPAEKRILIKRSELQSFPAYASTLLHECAHAISGAGDVNRDFELELTNIIGILISQLNEKKHNAEGKNAYNNGASTISNQGDDKPFIKKNGIDNNWTIQIPLNNEDEDENGDTTINPNRPDQDATNEEIQPHETMENLNTQTEIKELVEDFNIINASIKDKNCDFKNMIENIIVPLMKLDISTGASIWLKVLKDYHSDEHSYEFTEYIFGAGDRDNLAQALELCPEIKEYVFHLSRDSLSQTFYARMFIRDLVLHGQYTLADELIMLFCDNQNGDYSPDEMLYEIVYNLASSDDSKWLINAEGIDFIDKWLLKIKEPSDQAKIRIQLRNLKAIVFEDAPRGAMPARIMSEFDNPIEEILKERKKRGS